MDKTLVDSRGTLFLLLMMLSAKLLTAMPRMLAVDVGPSAWLVVLLAGLVALPPVWGLVVLLGRFPGQGLAAINEKALGPWVGGVMNLLQIAYFVTLGGLMLRAFVIGFRIAVMPKTPPSVLSMVIVSVALYTAFRGMEVMARMAAYLTPMLVVLGGLTLLGPVRVINVTNIFPLFGNGVDVTLLSPFRYTSLYSEILLLGTVAAMLPPGKIGQLAFKTMAWATAIQTVVMVALLAVFPYPAISRLFFPVLDLTRMIELSEFVQRVEALFVFLWFFVAAFELALLLLCSALVFQKMARLADHRPLLMPMTLILYSIAFMAANNVDLAYLDHALLRNWSWVVSIAMPMLTLTAAVLRGKRGETGHAA